MIKSTFTLWLCLACLAVSAQDKEMNDIGDKIVREGRSLYLLEMASWYGSDIFLSKYPNKEKIDGYFSYIDGSSIKNVFLSNGVQAKVIGTIEFDSTISISTAKVDMGEKGLSKEEQDIFIIRSLALKTIKEDTFFKSYDNTEFNLVPLIATGEKKVYVLTASNEKDNVILGNDYLLRYDDSNNLIEKKQLHKSLIRARYGEYNGRQITKGYHTHVIDDFITPTDICTIMLYEKIAKWDEYVVVSGNYFSIWNCKKNELLILSKDAAQTYFEKRKAEEAKR